MYNKYKYFLSNIFGIGKRKKGAHLGATNPSVLTQLNFY